MFQNLIFRPRLDRRRLLVPLAVFAAGSTLCASVLASTATARAAPPKPTVVLVHGAFADASGWTSVTARLQERGYTVIAPPNPLRGLAADSAYVASQLAQIEGPVVLVGHSYGGAVISNAATGNPNVKALVYIAAYAPGAGESIAALGARIPGGGISPATLTVRGFPAGDGTTAPEGSIKTPLFRGLFAADLPRAQANTMATAQRPIALGAFAELSGEPAWATIPSWYLVAGADAAIGPKLERYMAMRMKARMVEAKGASHVVFISRPAVTADIILAAAKHQR